MTDRRCWYLSLIVTAALLAGALACRHEEPLPVLYPVPDARMINQAGKPFDLASARGNVTVYDFIFTNCAASCPMMTHTMGALVKRTDRSQPVRFISISVDPLRDKPAVLASYASRSGADDRWSFLTGNPATVRSVTVNGFKLAVEPVQAGSKPFCTAPSSSSPIAAE